VLGAADPAYRVTRTGGGFQMTSRSQRLHAAFGRSGVLLSSGAVRVGLSLRAVGYGASLHAVGDATPRSSANRVLYTLPSLEEWYVNGPLGVEQGFTLPRALSRRATGPLTLAVALSGDARASLGPGGQSITFSAAGGATLRYGGLVATDARGRTLRSWLQLERGKLLLRVDARGARYPLRIDPLVQQTELTAAEGSNSGFFGASVALSANGNTALIGAPSVKSLGGTAWVFTRTGSTWTQQGPVLSSEEGEEGEEGESCEAGEERECGFGRSVALSGDGNTALIGAPRAEEHRGAAWVFTRSGSTWTRGQKLSIVGESGKDKARFGHSVALSADGKIALIGGSADKNLLGAAWVFARSGSVWTQQAKLAAAEEPAKGHFGASVALSGEGGTALIGGPGADAAWVFTRSGSAWTEQKKLTGEETVGFGGSVALSANGDTALVGASDDEGALGAAWVFTRAGAAWSQQGEKLTGEEEDGPAEFGASAALSADGNTALIGGPGDGEHEGASWLFARSGSTWTPQGKKRVAREESRHGWLGASVALSETGATALVGGPRDNNKTGASWVFVSASHEEETPQEETHRKEEEQRRAAGAESGSSSGAGVAAPGSGAAGGVYAFGPLAGQVACKVALFSKTVTVQSHNRAALKLRRVVGTGACTGTLKLSVRTKTSGHRAKTSTIGTGRFSIASGKVQVFSVTLNGVGRALLKARHGRLGASLVILRLSPRPTLAQTANVHLAVQTAHKATAPKK